MCCFLLIPPHALNLVVFFFLWFHSSPFLLTDNPWCPIFPPLINVFLFSSSLFSSPCNMKEIFTFNHSFNLCCSSHFCQTFPLFGFSLFGHCDLFLSLLLLHAQMYLYLKFRYKHIYFCHVHLQLSHFPPSYESMMYESISCVHYTLDNSEAYFSPVR